MINDFWQVGDEYKYSDIEHRYTSSPLQKWNRVARIEDPKLLNTVHVVFADGRTWNPSTINLDIYQRRKSVITCLKDIRKELEWVLSYKLDTNIK